MASVYARKLEQQYQTQEKQHTAQTQVQTHKKQWISKGEKIVYSFFAIIAIVSAIYIVSFSSSLDTVNRDIQKLESIVESQALTNEGLKAKVNELSEPSRIIEEAKANGLNLQNAKVEQANIVQ
jgi:cell division protein FtsL